jgi:hypothetical protein
MALRKFLILRKLPTGPRPARPEDKLRSCLEGCTALIQLIVNFLTASKAGVQGLAIEPCHPGFPLSRE